MKPRVTFPGSVVSWPLPILLMVASLGLLGLSGCSTAEMKGTPFYTGEAGRRPGAAEQRVNVWPLLYYREPALSIAWPVFELADDRVALRPLLSIYGRDETNQQYNILWPLAQFDRRTGDNRILPIFWGDDYRVAFPLYWHWGDPWAGRRGSDTLFPLWQLKRSGPEHYSFYGPGPLVRFWAEPRNSAQGSMILPFYYQVSNAAGSRFYSPFWWSEREGDGDYWRLLFPLYFAAAAGPDHVLATPVWAQGKSDGDEWRGMLPFWLYQSDGERRQDVSVLWPLLRLWTDGADAYGSRLLPFYWQEHEAGASRFYSLPWCYETAGDRGWRALLPLGYQSWSPGQSSFITPLYSCGQSGSDHWNMLLPLWYSESDHTNAVKLYYPLGSYRAARDRGEVGSLTLPLYWYWRRHDTSQFNSLFWWSHNEGNGDYWRLLPPLFYQERQGAAQMYLTPFWGRGRSPTNDWAAIFPLGYWDWQQHTLVSPLWAHWRSPETETWVAPELLSWRTRTAQRSDLNLLGGLARASWGLQPGADYVFPIYYHDAGSGLMLSPVWFQWREAQAETAVAPWLLSWRNRSPERTDLWLAAGLGRASWGSAPGPQYLIPFFYQDQQTLFTPLVGWNRKAGTAYFATPLAGVRTGNRNGSWLLPLYSHARNLITGDVNDWFLLLGNHHKTKQWSRTWFLPLFYQENRFPPEATGAAPKSRIAYGKSFWCLPFCWYRDQIYFRPERAASIQREADPAEAGSGAEESVASRPSAAVVQDNLVSAGMFPFWSYRSAATKSEQRSNTAFSLLLWLYDSKHTVGPAPGRNSAAPTDYRRARVLWRLWNYEEDDGAVSLDVFPAFTYDRRPDGFKKFSFLWRLIRYEHTAADETKLDLLFIPIHR